MAKKYTAEVTLQITVFFEDNGKHELIDQAYDAVWDYDFSNLHTDAGIEVHRHTINPVVPA